MLPSTQRAGLGALQRGGLITDAEQPAGIASPTMAPGVITGGLVRVAPGAYPGHMPLDPDTYTRISLIGTTERLHSNRVPRDQALAEVRHIAAGRIDLLASAAGHFAAIDTWSASSCYQLLVDAGADPDLIDAATERTRWNLERMGHTTAGTGGPRSQA